MIFRRFLQITIGLTCLSAGQAMAQDTQKPPPEIATGTNEQSTVQGSDFMAVTANPYATKAAYDILERGGSAADAAIAAQLVLGLVEPQSSGLGGGAFALVYDAKDKRLRTYDARETAPNLAGPFLFFENGAPIGFSQAVIGGRAVGVPGVPMLLSDLHERHGKLTWMELFDTAITLAEEGFTVSPRLAKMVERDAPRFQGDPDAANYFTPNGAPIKGGETLKNPAYLETLKDYRFFNARRFYHGNLAHSIVHKVQNYADNPGLLAVNDFANYTVKERPPVCGPYRDYIVCSMGEPSSGALTLLQTLGMLEHFNISKQNAQSWHIIAQASALAFADRAVYAADPDFVNTPNISLINPDYLKSRAALIDVNAPLSEITAGTPPDWSGTFEKGETLAQPGTTHISIVDKEGNIVSMTSSIEAAFGAHLMTNGFLLNNQLTDFSFNPIDDDRKFVANAVEAGKRPRSSMSPTIVFNATTGEPALIVGSAGGARIIGHVLQRIIAVIDWGMPIDEAIAAPHILARGETIELENGDYKAELEALGDTVAIKTINSGLTAIQISDKIITGTADPRREGQAQGR